MSFIDKSANYSQTTFLKTKLLAPVLNSYNTFVLNSKNVIHPDIYISLNNNKKYYCYITKKRSIEQCKEDYDILYFFPDEIGKEELNKLEVEHVTDICVEINGRFTDSFLLEGYLYKTDDNKNVYLATDILLKNENVVSCDYPLRYALLSELIFSLKSINNMNNHLTLGVHPVFHIDNENILKVFQHNFIFKQQLFCVEKIENFRKTRQRIQAQDNEGVFQKRISPTPLSDVYNVFDVTTGNHEGILYVKGIKESKKLKDLTQKRTADAFITCSYNIHFKKWQPAFDDV